MSNKLYTSIPAPKVPRNTFKRSRPNSLTLPFQRCARLCVCVGEVLLREHSGNLSCSVGTEVEANNAVAFAD